jgi:hypothetical protein
MKSIGRIADVVVTLIIISLLAVEATAKEKHITKKEVPPAVISAFDRAYPKTTIKGYSTETENGKTYFEIESMHGKQSLDVSYRPDGTVAEIEEGVAAKNLPVSVLKAVKAKYPKGRISKAEKKTLGTVVTYEMKVTTDKTHAGLEIDPTGKIIKERVSSMKENEEEK